AGDPPSTAFLRDSVGGAILNDDGFSLQRYAQGATSAGQITGFFNSAMVQGLLTAMQENQYGRVMARPKILVNDNQEGEIKTENIIPVALAKTNVIPGTATQTSTTVTDIVFEDYTAGVTLNITPHISKGAMLRLEITLNRTDFKENSNVEIKETDTSIPPKTITKEFPSPPDRISTDLMTVSTVPDGTTIILGGLESVAQSKLVKKVPILGDLPLVGGLFRDIDDSDSVGKLYVFVRANIIRPGDQLIRRRWIL
ncbi:MAG: type II secretion system protein GspD, partial [Planctomycetota bacterium]